MQELHDRMPVILSPNDYDVWLDPACDDRAGLEKLLDAYPADEMQFRPVSKTVSNARNEGPECVEPAE
jgi:putative SOS response-associated peptidase YedK